jgi:hypothetical protein
MMIPVGAVRESKITRDRCRGSRKHVLDWVSQPPFLEQLERLAAPAPVRIEHSAWHMPRGYDQPAEARLERDCPTPLLDEKKRTELRDWWLKHRRGANTPNWDLAVQCDIGGRPGLLLVEAKANEPELSVAGKALDTSAKRSDAARQRSKENHEQIRLAIESAKKALVDSLPAIKIDRDSHYQLANRIAFAWKLATLGVPTVLMYVGFIGDKGIKGYSRDDSHWSETFADHLNAVGATGITERAVAASKAEFWVLCRSRTRAADSPPPRPRRAGPAGQ